MTTGGSKIKVGFEGNFYIALSFISAFIRRLLWKAGSETERQMPRGKVMNYGLTPEGIAVNIWDRRFFNFRLGYDGVASLFCSQRITKPDYSYFEFRILPRIVGRISEKYLGSFIRRKIETEISQIIESEFIPSLCYWKRPPMKNVSL